MNEACISGDIVPSEPLFISQAIFLARQMRMKTVDELSELFSCSYSIGEQNKRRFEIFGTDDAEVMPAILAYFGQAYKHLKASELNMDDLHWASSHFWISSCLYGLLRPLDGISTYRMEGGFSLPDIGGKSVNEFWKPYLTDVLIESVLNDDGVLVYLDTEEFRHLFDWKKVVKEIPVIIEPKFHVMKNGKLTTPAVWAKTCRGAMARYIIDNRITSYELLTAFSYEGFCFAPTLSGHGKRAMDYTFVR